MVHTVVEEWVGGWGKFLLYAAFSGTVCLCWVSVVVRFWRWSCRAALPLLLVWWFALRRYVGVGALVCSYVGYGSFFAHFGMLVVVCAQFVQVDSGSHLVFVGEGFWWSSVGSAWFWVVLWDQLCDPAGSSVIEYFYSFLCAFVIIFIFLLRESPKVCVNFWLRIFSMLILRADLGCFSRCLCVCLSVRWTERTDIGSRLNY